jgi:hypothetical protein
VKVTENHHVNRMPGAHFGSGHLSGYMLAFFSSSHTPPGCIGGYQ